MNPEQLWDTTMGPSGRSIIQIKLEDAVEADLMFSTLMGRRCRAKEKNS